MNTRTFALGVALAFAVVAVSAPLATADSIGFCVLYLDEECDALMCWGYSGDNPDWATCQVEQHVLP